MFAQIAFNRPTRPLIYEVPQRNLHVCPGIRVLVDLRGVQTIGIVYRMVDSHSLKSVKPIIRTLDDEPVLNQELIDVAEWISQYYFCSIGEALWTIIPKGYKKREKRIAADDFHMGENETVVLTEEQSLVFETLKDALDNGKQKHFLLYGITGSGKTEIYLRIIHEMLKKGRSAILLVPEIALTPQTVKYFSTRVGDELAVLHSRLTAAEKINEWHRILNGKKRIVVGARSAVFAPMRNIGIIIVDEEHETSYKSDETPRYNAKSVAYYRAEKSNAVLLLGSATPSLESYYQAKRENFRLLRLTHRVLNQNLPSTYVTDLRKVKGQKYISNPLIKAITRRLQHREQTILFLNRRGFSPYVSCENCGHVFKCTHCDITLTYHQREKRLTCHYCGYFIEPPDTCPNCGYERLSYQGFGTEKIEEVLNEYFPGAVVVRMDTDTMKKRSSVHQVLSAFSKRQIDILIGTQIVTKGLHFPAVTLVGVLNADIPLNFPDFRAAERTFNLITQVAGRAGRSEKGGEVIIQTYNPVHYAIQAAKTQNYEDFFSREIKYRETLNYPPFSRIVRLVFRGSDSKKCFLQADYAVSYIKENTKSYTSILGPSLCPLSRIKNHYRVHVIIKLKQITAMRAVLKGLAEEMRKKHDPYLEIDVDPVSML